MQSVNLSNPIYQHSGESEKLKAIAQQASVTEDMEQRRRQLDSKGENRRILVAKEVAGMVEQYGGRVHLKATPFDIPKEPIISQATNAASSLLHSALDAGKNLLNSATTTTKGVADSAIHLGQDAAGYVASTTKGVADSALHLGQDAAGYVSSTTKGVADSAIHLGQDAAGYVASTTKGAADYITHTAQGAAHQASDLATIAANKSKDLASTAASKTKAIADVATTKAHEIADVATDKAHEIADNINHFTTLVSVLAEEENERARRLISGDEARAASNAFRVSELIRELGPAFYKQTPNLSYTTKVLEEAERRWRLNSTHASLAETNAHNVGKLVSKNLQNFMPRYQWVRSHINTIEEKERTRRLNDSNESYSIMNALRLSEIIRDLGLGFYRQEGTFTRTHAAYATTLLEEVERKDRIRLDKLHHAEDQAHLLSDVVANNMEKFNYTTRNAAQFANEFAKMLSTATKNVASNFAHLTQDFAKTATVRAKEVASEIASYSTRMYVVALEERERTRRLSDSNEINAIFNAWNQSALIRELGSLYRPSSLARFPIGLIEEQERRWRLSSLPAKSSKKLNEIVLANLAKFEAASSGSKKLNDIVLSNRNKFEAASSRSKKINDIVLSNLDKFESASSKLGEIEHAKDTAAHSNLNPNAPTFVPHQSFTEVKQEPIVQAPSIPRAAGAQF